MRKICLTLAGSFLLFLHSFSQMASDTSEYQSRVLKLEEVNLVSNYYSQTGDHSAITGGVGTQKLNDVSNMIELKFVKLDYQNHKQTLDFNLGIDHHTAASSAWVSKSGASRTGGTRVYPSASWQIENAEKRTTWGLGTGLSFEYTYHSFNVNGLFSKHSVDNNREFSASANIFLDGVRLVYPSELSPYSSNYSYANTSASGGGGSGGGAPKIPSSYRGTYATSFSFSQVLNRNMQIALTGDAVAQSGYLSLPFHRVYFSDKSVGIEKLPNARFKLPLGLRLNYFAGDRVIFRTYYRYYKDSWGISAHTASVEAPVKITPFLSVAPFYRYYIQSASNYFAPIYVNPAGVTYCTSNYDYSAFTSQYAGLNFRYVPLHGLFGIKNLAMIEFRLGHYEQTTGLKSNNFSLNLKFK